MIGTVEKLDSHSLGKCLTIAVSDKVVIHLTQMQINSQFLRERKDGIPKRKKNPRRLSLNENHDQVWLCVFSFSHYTCGDTVCKDDTSIFHWV